MGQTLSWDNADFSCPFTSLALVLAASYTALCMTCCRLLYRLTMTQPWKKRRAQKLFLSLAVSQSICRILYFLIWPTEDRKSVGCDPTASGTSDDPDGGFVSVLGTLPACLFLSQFSVNVYTFARIYHTVLSSQRSRFTFFSTILVIVNLVAYSFTLLLDVNESDKIIGSAQVVALSMTSLIVSFSFVTYATLLYFGVRSQLLNNAKALNLALTLAASVSVSTNQNNQIVTNNTSFNNNNSNGNNNNNNPAIQTNPLTPTMNATNKIKNISTSNNSHNSNSTLTSPNHGSSNPYSPSLNGISNLNRKSNNFSSNQSNKRTARLSTTMGLSSHLNISPHASPVVAPDSPPAQSRNYLTLNNVSTENNVGILASPVNGPIASPHPSSSGPTNKNKISVSSPSSEVTQKNPMLKLVIVSIICLVCFFTRSAVLPLLAQSTNSSIISYLFFAYFSISELVPMFLMLGIFDPASSRENNSSNQNGNNLQPPGSDGEYVLIHDTPNILPVNVTVGTSQSQYDPNESQQTGPSPGPSGGGTGAGAGGPTSGVIIQSSYFQKPSTPLRGSNYTYETSIQPTRLFTSNNNYIGGNNNNIVNFNPSTSITPPSSFGVNGSLNNSFSSTSTLLGNVAAVPHLYIPPSIHSASIITNSQFTSVNQPANANIQYPSISDDPLSAAIGLGTHS